jgi:purine-binding chemotaxis protein CheW
VGWRAATRRRCPVSDRGVSMTDTTRAEESPAEWARILHERAVRLAEVPPSDATGTSLEVLVSRVRTERYAIDLRDLRSVQRPTGLIGVPTAPPQVAGVLNVRGDLVAVLDLAAMLDLPPASPSPESLVLLVEVRQGHIGIRVDEVLGVQRVALADLDDPLAGISKTRGVAAGSIVILDLAHLLAEQPFGELGQEQG